MLFYDPKSHFVYSNYVDGFESFTPTANHQENGWLLIVVYTTYDSFESSDEERFAIVDLYHRKDDAKKAAENIFNNRFLDKNKMKNTLNNSYHPICGAEWIGWGSRVKRVELRWVDDFTKYKKDDDLILYE